MEVQNIQTATVSLMTEKTGQGENRRDETIQDETFLQRTYLVYEELRPKQSKQASKQLLDPDPYISNTDPDPGSDSGTVVGRVPAW